ncbi:MULTISPECIES: 2-oxoglutarate and iron-dependent oxygenase domain-containing protein [unclassified Streptomyces]|uniref:2-oxoglutarate and iron-dependent oxygenase domain-containing protein n=1 Tax=Streptomyces sp. R33 TaxID=3238629 RepID=A0AB39XV43_9ACTN|nr:MULTISPECIES: 2-oxoglutarate and iron-dependent oxygenase domain-containing protein [unclassified Streptomyces]KJY24421.1 MFS transporter [Streptomyces sp. NRRL S-444]KOY55154.1 MFS transporter [Streptomyces sp. XY332]
MAGFSTFLVPERVKATAADQELGRRMVRAWQQDGIFQVRRDPDLEELTDAAMCAARAFFRLPLGLKHRCVNDLSYSGYIESGEELTAGVPDQPEIFTVTPHFDHGHRRVRKGMPCHGPVPWPGDPFRYAIEAYLCGVGELGERILRLVALGLGLGPSGARQLTGLTRGGWHHLRALHFPARTGESERGIGAHTDYGLLVIAAQDEVGGLYVRPPVEGEQRSRNWVAGESSAGRAEDAQDWRFVEPESGVLTVFPGDILEFLTRGVVEATAHRVRLAERERYALAYFHEPHFDARMRPLGGRRSEETLHYGRHFTDMFMRCYPERATTRRIIREDRLAAMAP